MKRCGKSAPRLRQRNRHGKPHREQDRIGTATRECSLRGDNTAGRCQARRPGRLLEATCKRCPRGMAVTYCPRKRAVPYRTRLTGRLMPIWTFSSEVGSSSRQIDLEMRGPAPYPGPLATFAARMRPQLRGERSCYLRRPCVIAMLSDRQLRTSRGRGPGSRATPCRRPRRRPAHRSSPRENRINASSTAR